RLDQREFAERAQLDRDRVEKHDLEVEQDEQHRDQVEADPEAHPLLDLGGEAALVRVLLVRDLSAGPDERVERRERPAHDAAKKQEDDSWEVATQHRARCYSTLWQSVT